MSTLRDCGSARDCTETTWPMQPTAHLERAFIAAAELGDSVPFEGGGVVISVGPYCSSTDVERLLGDRSKARKQFGWAPAISRATLTLVKEAVLADPNSAKLDAFGKLAGFKARDKSPRLRVSRPSRPGGAGRRRGHWNHESSEFPFSRVCVLARSAFFSIAPTACCESLLQRAPLPRGALLAKRERNSVCCSSGSGLVTFHVPASRPRRTRWCFYPSAGPRALLKRHSYQALVRWGLWQPPPARRGPEPISGFPNPKRAPCAATVPTFAGFIYFSLQDLHALRPCSLPGTLKEGLNVAPCGTCRQLFSAEAHLGRRQDSKYLQDISNGCGSWGPIPAQVWQPRPLCPSNRASGVRTNGRRGIICLSVLRGMQNDISAQNNGAIRRSVLMEKSRATHALARIPLLTENALCGEPQPWPNE